MKIEGFPRAFEQLSRETDGNQRYSNENQGIAREIKVFEG
jgi:hypothetical protein